MFTLAIAKRALLITRRCVGNFWGVFFKNMEVHTQIIDVAFYEYQKAIFS